MPDSGHGSLPSQLARSALIQLKRRMAGIERHHRLDRRDADGMSVPASLGHDDIDAVLGGGIARARLHELFAAHADDAASAAGFAAMLAVRIGGPVLWLREDRAQCAGGGLFAPGLADIGLDPGRLLMLLLPDPLAILRAAADALRCNVVGAVVIELWGRSPLLDLTASRRLGLAASESGATPLVLRIDAGPVPSAAWTRWQIAAAPSIALEANAPGHPTMMLDLLRQRGRPDGGRWHVEWNRDQSCLSDARRPANAATAPDILPGTPARHTPTATLSGHPVPPVASRAPIRRVA